MTQPKQALSLPSVEWRLSVGGLFTPPALITLTTLLVSALLLAAPRARADHSKPKVVVSEKGERFYIVEADKHNPNTVYEPAPSAEVEHAPPPPPSTVVVYRPAPPCPGAIWVDGHYIWDGYQYVWVPGYYQTPRPGYVFVQPRWVVHAGFHFHIGGYFYPRHRVVRHIHHYRHPYYRHYRNHYYGHRYGYHPHRRYGHHRYHHRKHHGKKHYRARPHHNRSHRSRSHQARPQQHRPSHRSTPSQYRSPQRSRGHYNTTRHRSSRSTHRVVSSRGSSGRRR